MTQPALFKDEQLRYLRAEYSQFRTMDPDGEVYPKLCAFLDGLPMPNLQQLADANIKFVSNLAQNRVNKRATQ